MVFPTTYSKISSLILHLTDKVKVEWLRILCGPWHSLFSLLLHYVVLTGMTVLCSKKDSFLLGTQVAADMNIIPEELSCMTMTTTHSIFSWEHPRCSMVKKNEENIFAEHYSSHKRAYYGLPFLIYSCSTFLRISLMKIIYI